MKSKAGKKKLDGGGANAKRRSPPSPKPSETPKTDVEGQESDEERPQIVGSQTPSGAVPRKRAADFVAEGVQDDTPTYATEEDEVLKKETMMKLPEFDAGLPMDQQLLESITAGVVDKSNPFAMDEIKQQEELSGEQEASGEVDLVGDGGVQKVVVRPGSGNKVTTGSTVYVRYVGSLQSDGKVFDENKEGQEPFSFKVGSGDVIKGWEVAVATMTEGEVAKITCAPRYAYGRRGAPPVIPPNSTLCFEIELLSVELPSSSPSPRSPETFAEDNPDVPRTPDEIANAYFAKLANKKESDKKSFWDRFYFISPFASQTGEAPPWWLNPNITFILVFLFVAFGFYVVYAVGGVRQGFVEDTIDVNIFK